MAPLVSDLQAWVTGGSPALTVLSLIVLFIIIINLVSLCTTCQKQSFELEHEAGAGVERSSSTLVRVVKLEDAQAGVDNAGADKDEMDLSSIPESNGEFTSWRNHTSPQPNGLPQEAQVGNGAAAVDMDGKATPRHGLHTVPTIAPHKEVESHVQSAHPHVSFAVDTAAVADPAPSESAGGSLQDWARAQAERMANNNGQSAQEPPNLLQIPAARSSQHDYETISEVLKQANLELYSNSEQQPLDVPSYQFVTQLEPYATSPPALMDPPQATPAPHTSTHLEVEEIADLEDRYSTAMYARVSKRIKCPTPPPVPPPDEDEEEEVEEIGPPLPDRALDTDDDTTP